jgi:tetratricopeptide (TPR) repeat protein
MKKIGLGSALLVLAGAIVFWRLEVHSPSVSDTGKIEALMKAGQNEEALRQLEQVKDPKQAAWVLLQRARCLDELGRYREAVAAYEALLSGYPDSPQADAGARNDCAWILATSPDPLTRNPERAIFHMEKAIAGFPDDFGLLDTLAAAYASAGRFDKAVEHQREAAVRIPRKHNSAKAFQDRLFLYLEKQAYVDPALAERAR